MTLRGDELASTARMFVQSFSATPRGARLARRLAAQQLEEWGLPYGDPVGDVIVLVVAELANNAALHRRENGPDDGPVGGPGHTFELRLTYDTAAATFRIEVADRHPGRPTTLPPLPDGEAENGRGLLLVAALAARWGVCAGRTSDVGKVVFAEVDVSTG